MFKSDYGVIVALDYNHIGEAKRVIDIASDIDGVVGYKTGCSLALERGLPRAISELRHCTDLPLIYDHQKMHAEDEEDAEPFVRILKESCVDGGIFFANVNPHVQKVFTECFLREGVTPFVLARATWDGVLVSEGGIMIDEAPGNNYRAAAIDGVEYFIMPGNRPREVRKYVKIVKKNIPKGSPTICMPGFGSQKGEIRTAFEAAYPFPSYAIIGPADCIDGANESRTRDDIKRYSDEALETGALLM